MARATLDGTILAESDTFELVEGNVYFPPESIRWEFFSESDRHTTCWWKGVASYYTVTANGRELRDVAWCYPEPLPAAANITDYVAFYPAVQVEP